MDLSFVCTARAVSIMITAPAMDVGFTSWENIPGPKRKGTKTKGDIQHMESGRTTQKHARRLFVLFTRPDVCVITCSAKTHQCGKAKGRKGDGETGS